MIPLLPGFGTPPPNRKLPRISDERLWLALATDLPAYVSSIVVKADDAVSDEYVRVLKDHSESSPRAARGVDAPAWVHSKKCQCVECEELKM